MSTMWSATTAKTGKTLKRNMVVVATPIAMSISVLRRSSNDGVGQVQTIVTQRRKVATGEMGKKDEGRKEGI